MYSFFVLGMIPGTSIEISFTMWLEATAALLLSVLLLRSMWKRAHPAMRLAPSSSNDQDVTQQMNTLKDIATS